jgi:hypothetical protein
VCDSVRVRVRVGRCLPVRMLTSQLQLQCGRVWLVCGNYARVMSFDISVNV